jgi:hypothetical protein
MAKQDNQTSIEWAYLDKGGIGWLCPFCGNMKDDIFIIPDGRIVCAGCMEVWEEAKAATKQ